MSYTLKLDLNEYELNVLATLLTTDAQRSEREGTTDSPWATGYADARRIAAEQQ